MPGVREDQIEEQPPPARVGRAADDLAIVQLAPRDAGRPPVSASGETVNAVLRQRLRDRATSSDREDAAGVQEDRFEQHSPADVNRIPIADRRSRIFA